MYLKYWFLFLQQLELPVDKNDSRSSAFSSYASGRSPSPSQLLESLDPVVTSGNSTFPTVSNHPSFVHQKPQQPQGRPMMQTHRNSPPNTTTINVGKLVNKEPTSSSAVGAFQDHNYYHIQYPLNESPITPKTMQSSPGDTHSHLHFPSKNLLQSLSSANNNFSSNGNSNGNPTSLSSNTVTNKQTELLQAEEYQKTAKTLMSDSSEILVKGSRVTTNMTSLNEPPLQQHIKGQIKDKDYSYVKFMRREPPHEYSYPKLPIDPTANINVTTSTTTTLNSSTTTTSGIPVMPSCVGKTDPIKFPQVRNETEDSKSQSSGVKDSPSSSNGSQSGVSGGNWARIGNNNGSRYKVKSHEHTPGEVDDKNLASINDYTAYLVKPSESVGSLYQLEKNTTGERNSLVGSCCSGSDSSCSGDSKKSCTKKHNHNRQKSGKSKGGFKSCSSGKSHSHHYQIPSSQTQFTSELESKSGKSAVYSPGGTPRSSGIPGCPGSLLGGPGGSPTNAMTLTCAHCRESFSADDNRLGDCADAPSLLRKGIETMTCLSCAQALLYHCMSDTEGDYVHPCECSNADGHAVRRWIGLTLLSVLVPCLCCYVPLISCYRCGELCNVCGGRHEASDS